MIAMKQKNISTFAEDILKLFLLQNSGELLAADPNERNFTINNDKNGTSYKSADHHTAIDVEKTDDGTILII